MVHAYFEYMTSGYPRRAGHGMLLVQLHGPAAGQPWAPVGARRMLARAGKRAGLGIVKCPVLLIMRHGQRAELRCLKYLRRLRASVVSPIMRQIDTLSVLSHQVKGAGASSWRDADPDA